MNVGNDTTASDGSLDQGVELFVASDGQLEVSRSNSLHFEILASVSSELEDLSGQVLKDSCGVDS